MEDSFMHDKAREHQHRHPGEPHHPEHHDHSEHAHAVHPSQQPSVWQNPIVIASIIIGIAIIIGVGMFLVLGNKAPVTPINPDANDTVGGQPVLIEEYSDFQCPYCQQVYPVVEQLRAKYGNQVKFEYKQFPLRSIHPLAEISAQASECARDQGKFDEYYQVLFTKRDWLQGDTAGILNTYASNLGLNVETFSACVSSGSKKTVTDADLAQGSSRGVQGTPTFFINGQLYDGPRTLEGFSAKVDAAKGGTVTVTPVVNDPPIALTIITDTSCTICSTTSTQLLSALKGQVLPSVQETLIDSSSTQGQAMIAQLNINALPAFVFSKDLEKAANYAQLSSAVRAEGDQYVLADGVASQFGAIRWMTPPQAGTSPSIGPADAPVTIIEFSDFQCPYCDKFYSDTEQALLDKYAGKVRFVYKQFPLNSIHPQAQKASEASLCAADQNKFWEYHHQLFDTQSTWSGKANANDQFKAFAADLNLDTNRFNNCLDSDVKAAEVEADLTQGSEFGVSGTPGFFINGINLGGAYPLATFEQIIDEQLAKGN